MTRRKGKSQRARTTDTTVANINSNGTSSLPATRTTIFKSPVCSICDDEICALQSPIIKLPCGHSFGGICIEAWNELVGRCPVCYTKTDLGEWCGGSEQVRLKAMLNARAKIGTSGHVAGGLVQMGENTSNLFAKASTSLSTMITDATSSRIESSKQSQVAIQPLSQTEKNEVKKTLANVNVAAATTASVTGTVSNWIGTGLWTLGSFLAPGVSAGSKKILTSAFNMDEKRAEDAVSGTMETSKGFVISAGKVMRGLEYATTTVVSSAASNAARIYELNHGMNQGELESDVGEVAKNVTKTAFNVAAFPPKSISSVSRAAQPEYQSKENTVRYEIELN